MTSQDAKYHKLEKQFSEAGIPTDGPGFFDHPRFLAKEEIDPNFLDEYARFVHWRRYDDTYLERAERGIRIAAGELHRGLILEGRLGGCIDASMTLARILDLHGIWNYVVRGALCIDFPPRSGYERFCFWPIDENDGTGREYGHKWVYAPPLCIVDVTIRLQDYPQPFQRLLPEAVFERYPTVTEGQPDDILCPGAIRWTASVGLTSKQALAHMLPKFVESFAPDFSAYLVKTPDGLQLKYVPVGIGGSDAPLERIRSFSVKGRTALEFYESDIKPKLAAVGL